jgi:hypothetical protein
MKNEAIEMIKLPLSSVRIAVFCLPLALVASCGSGSEAVQGTVIKVSPVTVGVTSPATATLTELYIIQPYQIELRSPTGYPQVNTKVTIVNRGTLYDEFAIINPATVTCTGGPGVNAVCTDSALTPLPSVYETTTDSTGTVRVMMLYGFYSGIDGTETDLEAFSGTGYGKTDIVFTCVDGSTATCP